MNHTTPPWTKQGSLILARFGASPIATIDEDAAPGDADLIVAAPEMYDALVYAVECAKEGIQPGKAWLNRACAALNVANGEDVVNA